MDKVTADAALVGDGPVNPAFQELLNRDAQIVLGTVTILALTVDGVGEQPVTPTPGLISTTGDVLALGIVQAGTRVEAGTEHFTGTGAGKVHMDQKGLRWDDITDQAAGGPNPARTEPLLNQLRAINTPKAWCVIRTADGGFPGYFVDGAGFAGGNLTAGTPSKFEFVMAQHMASMNYAVFPTARNVASGNIVPLNASCKLTRTATNTFELEVSFDLSASNTEIMVEVFGRQTT